MCREGFWVDGEIGLAEALEDLAHGPDGGRISRGNALVDRVQVEGQIADGGVLEEGK